MSRLPLIVAAVAAAAVTAAIVIAAIIVVPQIVRVAQTDVAASDTRISLSAPGVSATIPVAAGWSYVVDPFEQTRAVLRSPDATMTVELTAASGTDPEQATREVVGAAVTPFDREPVGSSTVLHARIVGEDAIVGAVVSGDASVIFVCRPGAVYEAELARLLSGIEVAP